MKRNPSINLKASFLLAVFALNTLAGFACSLGVDMGYNSKHHSKGNVDTIPHIYKDGKKNIRYEKKEKHSHKCSLEYVKAKEYPEPGPEKDCCGDQVRNFQFLDKTLPENSNIVHPVFATAFFDAFYKTELFYLPDLVKDIKQFVRSYHPPISNIRIAIQSFQI